MIVKTSYTERARTQRLGSIRAELLERIRPVCRDWPDELFFEMIDAMAAVQLKYELSGRDPGERTLSETRET